MSFFNELKQRSVIRVAAAYLVIGWLLAQIATTLEDALNLPAWFDTLVVTLLMIGFPIALLFSWAFELTPDGIKKESEIDRSNSVITETAKKLDIITLVAAVGVALMFVWQQTNQRQDVSVTETTNKEPARWT